MSWMEEVGLEEELKEERVEKLDELVTQVVDQMMVPAEGGNGVQVWEAATLASREKLEAGDEEKAVDEGILGDEGETTVVWRFSIGSSCRSTYLRFMRLGEDRKGGAKVVRA